MVREYDWGHGTRISGTALQVYKDQVFGIFALSSPELVPFFIYVCFCFFGVPFVSLYRAKTNFSFFAGARFFQIRCWAHRGRSLRFLSLLLGTSYAIEVESVKKVGSKRCSDSMGQRSAGHLLDDLLPEYFILFKKIILVAFTFYILIKTMFVAFKQTVQERFWGHPLD